MIRAADAAFEVAFLEKLQRLLAEGSFTATYKFAVLLGLVDLSVEALPGVDTFTTWQLAEKVSELYWPQVLPFDEVSLRHSGQQARIVLAVADHQRRRPGPFDNRIAMRPHVVPTHFLPWARYPDNRLANLVPAHEACNGSKSAYLAAVEHLDGWLRRFTDAGLRDGMHAIAEGASWPAGDKETLAVSRVLYAQQPEGARLWYGPGVFRVFARNAVEQRIDAAIRSLAAA